MHNLQHTFTNLTDVQKNLYKSISMTISAMKAQKGTECFIRGAKAVSNELMLTYKVQLTQALKGNEHTPSTKNAIK